MDRKKFSKRLVSLRKSKGLSTQKLADAIGLKSKGAITQFEKAMTSPSSDTLVALAKVFDVSVDYLLGMTDNPNANVSEIYVENKEGLTNEGRIGNDKNGVLFLGNVKEIPIYSLQPKNRDEIFAQENIIGREPVPADTLATIAVRMNDDSMSGSRINEGDRVIIREQNTFNDGQTVVVQLPDRSLIIRKATYTNDGIILSPENSAYQPQHFKQNELNIIGIVIQVNFDFT